MLQALRWAALALRHRRLPLPRQRAARLTRPGGPADREALLGRQIPALRLLLGILSRCSLTARAPCRQSADHGDPALADLARGTAVSLWIQQAALL